MSEHHTVAAAFREIDRLSAERVRTAALIRKCNSNVSLETRSVSRRPSIAPSSQACRRCGAVLVDGVDLALMARVQQTHPDDSWGFLLALLLVMFAVGALG